MTENKKPIPEITENKPMTDEQLEEVAGGGSNISAANISAANMSVANTSLVRCAANPAHTYLSSRGTCPQCGCKESIPF